MQIGYARTSTVEQKAGLEAQLRDLKAAGVKKTFSEQLSSVDSKRDRLEAAIDFCREGDVLVCTKLDRLARSVADVVVIEKRLREKGAALHIMDPAMDTSTPAGRLIFNVIASIAQFEREIMLTRQREGIAKAKDDGKYKGRAPTARSRADRILELSKQGMNAKAIVETLGKELDKKGKPIKISERSVYRVLADAKGNAEGRMRPATEPGRGARSAGPRPRCAPPTPGACPRAAAPRAPGSPPGRVGGV